MLDLREVGIDFTEEDPMLVQLLLALVGEAVFGAINARHRGFRAEMERYLDEGSIVRRGPHSPAR